MTITATNVEMTVKWACCCGPCHHLRKYGRARAVELSEEKWEKGGETIVRHNIRSSGNP